METSYRTPPLMSESTGDVAIVFGEFNLACGGGTAGRNLCYIMIHLPRQWHSFSAPNREQRAGEVLLPLLPLGPPVLDPWEDVLPSVSRTVSSHEG